MLVRSRDTTEGFSLVDYNRAGVPLMELVTEPDMHTAEDAVAFMRELQLVLRYLGVSDADLERGQMRADANISISPTTGEGAGKLGTRAEVKNLNSFNSVAQAINYEIRRQTELLERGETVAQETRGWDDAKQKTTSQRSKEEAQDYRYFPEPDIPPFDTSVFDIERLRAELPELPAARRTRFAAEYGLDAKQTEILVSEPALANFFEEAVSELREQMPDESAPKSAVATLYNYLTSDLRGLMNAGATNFADLKITPEHLAHLAALLEAKKLTSRQAKDILAKMFETGADPTEIVASENIGVSDDSAEIEAVVAAVIAENKSAADDYRRGKTAVLQFLIGQAMKALKGRARPEVLKEMLEKGLG